MNMQTLANSVDPAALGRVAVLLGGRSSEREVSLMSGKGVLAALRARGVDAVGFDPAERALEELIGIGVQRAFITLHGRFGEDGTVQGALELLGIPYTGPGVQASALAIDKHMTKRIWRCDGLSTPGWRMVASAAQARAAAEELGLPLMFKAAHEGSTLGMRRADLMDEVDAAYQEAARFDAAVLAEQFIEGDEVTIAVLGEGESARTLPIIQIVAPGGNYDFEHKYYSDDTRYICPAPLPGHESEAIAGLALDSYRSLGCRGWGRVDVMIRASDRKPFLLEINTSPGMTGHSLVPMAAAAGGIPYEDLCLRVLADARLDGGRGGAR